MVKSCAICKSNREASEKLYEAPNDAQRRKAWSTSCGIDISETSLVCERHFKSDDFRLYGRGTTKSLKKLALPRRLPLAHVRPEPEFVPVNEDAVAKAVQANVVIKEEPAEQQPLTFIDEDCLDVHSEDPIRTRDSSRKQAEKAAIEERLSSVAVKTLACGQIVMESSSDGAQKYKLICTHCQSSFEAVGSDFWSKFVKHISDAHIPAPRVNSALNESINNTTEHTQKPTLVLSKGLDENLTKVENEQSHDIDESFLNDDEVLNQDESFYDNSNDFNDTEDSTDLDDEDDESFEPQAKRSKKNQATKLEEKNELELAQNNGDIVTFDHPDRNCVITLLELLTTRAILWLPRQSIMKRYDQSLTDLTNKFNEFFPRYAVSKETMRQSLKAIKDLYQRLSESEKADNKIKRRSKILDYKFKFPEYFELCAEIEENSKNIIQNCNICKMCFYSPQDLQVHKFKKHKIGELPFKCQRCRYGFATAEKLASHEETHNRVKNFKCELCGQGFYFESKLQAHLILHTDDSKKICEICGKKFPSLSKYRRHKLHHEAPKEKCKICGKLYFEKWTLTEHMKSHKNERQYRCDICGKSFNRQEGVTIHKRGVHKIKTQTKKYVWINRVTSTTSDSATPTTTTTKTADSSQHEEDNYANEEFTNQGSTKSADIQNTNSNSTIFSSAANDETIGSSFDVKPTIPANNTSQQQNIFPLEMLTSLLN